MPQGVTINSDAYCTTLTRLKRAIQNRRRGLLSSCVILPHNNAQPLIAGKTKQLQKKFQVRSFEPPTLSPDLAPSDFHLFANEQAAEVHAKGIQKFVTR